MNAASDPKFPTFRRAGNALRNLPRAGFPTFRRAARRFRKLFFSRKSLTVYLILATLTVLFYTGYRWHGRRAWAAERERLVAAGESVTIEQLREPLPPEEENFFATPALKELFLTGANAEHCKMWLGKRTVTAYLRGKPYEKDIPYPHPNAPLANWVKVLRDYDILPAPPSPGLSPAEELLADHRFDALIEELCAAASRPQAMFLLTPASHNLHLRSGDTQLSALLIRSLLLHARARLETGDSRRAAEIYAVFSKFTEGFARQGPTLDFLMTSLSTRCGDDLLRVGIRERLWKEQDLLMMQKADSGPLLEANFKTVIRYDRIFTIGSIQNYKANLPHIYINENGLRKLIGELYLKMIPDGWWMKQCVEISRYKQAVERVLTPLETGETWGNRLRFLKELEVPRWNETLHRFASHPVYYGGFDQIPEYLVKTLLREDLRQLAIALERHRLREGGYPAALADLRPLPEGGIPQDFDGQPMRYRANADGSDFLLWSIGPNGADETSAAPVKPEHQTDDLRFGTEKTAEAGR